ncbi:sulfate ABC transporter ATP-binding protein [bacterium]|nr:sulfate ABC transporter ATP-binding protein [bacterium]
MSIEIHGVSKQFGQFSALNNVSLSIPAGEFVALLGPSGSGKTTLLRMIAGLDTPNVGRLLVNGVDIQEQSVRERGVGFVFQHYALFRHMTVFENIAFGLRIKPKSVRLTDTAIHEKVMSLLGLVQLDWLADRFPSQLSGGQRQRIALARALAVEPKLLLLDEPFGALDSNIRKELRSWLRGLHDRLGITSVFVTHDVDEAMEMADRVVVMKDGRIEQDASPEIIYHQPANSFVYRFIGNVNLFHGRIDEQAQRFGQRPVGHSDAVRAYIRPSSMQLHLAVDNSSSGFFGATIKRLLNHGLNARVELISEWGEVFEVAVDPAKIDFSNLTPGRAVFVSVDQSKVYYEDFSI